MRWLPRAAMFVVTSPVPGNPGADVESDVESEETVSSFTAREVLLDNHLAGVAAWAHDLAENVGLTPELAGDVALAARLHDLGKADPRFQVWLRQGDEISAATDELLAKSSTPAGDARRRTATRERSGYPAGARHELLSLALVQHDATLAAQAHDWDLVLHLVAAHHGHCRPFAPTVPDIDPQRVVVEVAGRRLEASSDHGCDRLDSGVADRFWGLVQRYGWFRLAWLEALVRLADHRRSEAEQMAEAEQMTRSRA